MFGTLRELREKEVINISDGTRYGFVGDLDVDLDAGRVRALVIPGPARFFGLFGRRDDIVIPWEDVRRFGADIILVEGTPIRQKIASKGRP